jgi:hypothetical protein
MSLTSSASSKLSAWHLGSGMSLESLSKLVPRLLTRRGPRRTRCKPHRTRRHACT